MSTKNLVLMIFLVSLVACKRKEPEEPKGTAGKGGGATLNVVSKHHSKIIDSVTVYIKYNEQNTPSSYDDSVKAVEIDGKPVAVFGQLKAGQYYLYGRGWDTSISNTVIGGLPYTITEEKALDVTLSVTEGD